ncbi:biotin-protein ligase [Schistosoma mansoni]|uniref:Biotin-protein ligase n=1 Tax=Schistosoma mansoni TaxID=6183 RepID=G4LV76_SCHMA|nr:biotin-protein ligase [Schistosoma mansoni]|eukprot:XP_018645177.1 biotin-protein ligase [Schistosoma mansoni]
MVHKQIQIYNDLGTSEKCFIHLKNAFQYITPSYSIEEVNGTEINHHNIQSDLLCFGGGYDLGYLKSLQLSGCLKVHHYIKEKMGRYLGICAGAYFACDYCSFDMNGPLEVYGERHIKLFQGIGSGPIFPGFQYNSENGSYAVSIQAVSKNLIPQTAIVYYNGGCTFESINWENSQILYTYSDNGRPAIIGSKLGNGSGILSGVHFEYDPYLLEKQLYNVDPKNNDNVATLKNYEFIETLKTNNSSRLKLFETLITLLLNPDNNSVLMK